MRRSTSLLIAALLVASTLPAVLGTTPAAASAVAGTDVSYTTDSDFDQGTLVNVNHDAPGSGQLQLNRASGTFPFIWVALSQRCTIAKIDTRTGAIKGEYRTVSDGTPCGESSRTTVALDGSVWVGHRFNGRITHVALEESNNCIDRNGNGTIETSSGYGDVEPWPGPGAAASAAVDECILHHVNTGGGDSRHMSIDEDNDLWVGDRAGGSVFRQYDGGTGALLAGPFDFACGGYGGLIDSNGVIWSASSGGSILRWDTSQAPATARCLPYDNYGLAIDSLGNVWATTLNAGVVRKFAPSGALLGTFSQGNPRAQGLAIDGNDHVWISSSLFDDPGRLAHLRNDGSLVGVVTLTGGGGVTGVSVDAAGKVWSANRSSHTATRVDPSAGPVSGGTPVGAQDLTVNFPATPGRPLPYPYNYSDMTGAQLLNSTAPQGTWTVTQDAGAAGAEWGRVTWNREPAGRVPPGSSLTVEARAADTEAGLGAVSYAPLANGVDFSLAGRFLQVRATFRPSAAPDSLSPVLSDLRVQVANEQPKADAGDSYTVPEGGLVVLSASASSDPDGDPLSHEWDLDGSGFVSGASTANYDADGKDGPSLETVRLRVCDPSGACDVDDAVVTITNVAPGASAGADQTVSRGQTVHLSGSWSDPARALDDPYAWSWDVPGDLTSGAAVFGAPVARTASFASEGVYTVTFGVRDDDGGSGSDSAVITVLNRAPSCDAVQPSRASLWPPNHQFVDIALSGATDTEGDALTYTVTGIRQDEPTNTLGDGDTAPDGKGVGTPTASVRAERAGTSKVPGDGRVYHLAYQVTDGHGGSCDGVTQVSVPHSQNGAPAVDGGPLYDSTTG